MSLGDDAPGAHHVEMLAVDATYRPSHAKPWRADEDEAHREIDALTEELFALREQRDYLTSGGMLRDLDDRIDVLERRRDGVESWARPDPRLSSSMGTDERQQWREVS